MSRKCGKVKGAGVVKARMMPGAKVLLSRHDWTLACIESADPDKFISRSTISPGGTRRVLYFPRGIRDPPHSTTHAKAEYKASCERRQIELNSLTPAERGAEIEKDKKKKQGSDPPFLFLPITRPY